MGCPLRMPCAGGLDKVELQSAVPQERTQAMPMLHLPTAEKWQGRERVGWGGQAGMETNGGIFTTQAAGWLP